MLQREQIEELSIITGEVNPKYTGFIISAYGRLCELPLGYALNFGYVEKRVRIFYHYPETNAQSTTVE